MYDRTRTVAIQFQFRKLMVFESEPGETPGEQNLQCFETPQAEAGGEDDKIMIAPLWR